MGQRAGGQPSGAQLLEAINENLESLAQPGKRPVMVVMRLGGAATSQIRPEVVRETIRKTGIQLFALSPPNAGGGGGGMPMSAGGGGGAMGQARQDYAASESTYRGRNLESVLNDGSKQSGGRHIYFSGPDDPEGHRPAHAGAAEPVSNHLHAPCRHEAERPYSGDDETPRRQGAGAGANRELVACRTCRGVGHVEERALFYMVYTPTRSTCRVL